MLGSLAVKRPVLALSLNGLLLLLGILAFTLVEWRHSASHPNNEVQIMILYAGAHSLVVESEITRPLEQALMGLDGIKRISSESQDGLSRIFVKFKRNAAKELMLLIRDRVMSTAATFPKSAQKPYIWEQSERQQEILMIGFRDLSRSTAELSDYLRRNIFERLTTLDGIAEVRSFGQTPYVIELRLDSARLFEHHISVSDLLAALKNEKVYATGGELDTPSGKRSLILSAELHLPQDIGNWTITTPAQKVLKLSDISEVVVTGQKSDFNVHLDGKPMVGYIISAKPQSNPLEVVKQVKQFIQRSQEFLPDSMTVDIVKDASQSFLVAQSSAIKALGEACVLVALIVYICLGSWRAAALAMSTVPLCLVGSFIFIWLLGFSINPMTLLAIVVAVGLVVDDAIVVIENIHRHREQGLPPLKAALLSMQEISFAVVVMTVTLVAVYLPIAFQTSETALMLREFAWTLAGSVLISGFVALTLTPAIAARLKTEAANSHIELYQEKITSLYKKLLGQALNYPGKIMIAALCIALIAGLIFNSLPSELTPAEDEDLLEGYVTSPENAVLPNLQAEWKKFIEREVATLPEKKHLLVYQWQDQIWWQLLLKPRSERSRSARDIAEALEPQLDLQVGPHIGVTSSSGSLGNDDNELRLVIQYSKDYGQLIQASRQLIEALEKTGLFSRIWSESTHDKARYKLAIDKLLASQLGIGISTLEGSLYTLLSGSKVLDFPFDGFNYEVWLKSDEKDRSQLSGLNRFFINSNTDKTVPLGSLVNIQEVLEPLKYKHHDQMRAVSIHINPKPDIAWNSMIQRVEHELKQYMPSEGQYKLLGKAEQYQEARSAMLWTFGFALLFIYLLLAGLFESFIDPGIVLFTVPLSVMGAVWLVFLMGGSNNIYTQIGIITLMGLITKHGILITDFANQLQKEAGLMAKEAAFKAAVSRLRPILMTTLAMIVGALPLVMGEGAFAEARKHLGWVLIGGMLSGTLFSLFVVPAVYCVFQRKTAKSKRILPFELLST